MPLYCRLKTEAVTTLGPGGKPVRALVVEDDKDLNRQLVAALTDAGFAVDSAGDGEDGYFLGETEPYDVVILDIGLPEDGRHLHPRAVAPRRA